MAHHHKHKHTPTPADTWAMFFAQLVKSSHSAQIKWHMVELWDPDRWRAYIGDLRVHVQRIPSNGCLRLYTTSKYDDTARMIELDVAQSQQLHEAITQGMIGHGAWGMMSKAMEASERKAEHEQRMVVYG